MAARCFNTRRISLKGYILLARIEVANGFTTVMPAVPWLAIKLAKLGCLASEVLNGLQRIGFTLFQQIIWNKGRAVLTRTPYWFAHEPCWFVRKTLLSKTGLHAKRFGQGKSPPNGGIAPTNPSEGR